MTMTTPTPGRRLHAALLAHGILVDDWDDLSPTWRRDLEAAAREYEGDDDDRLAQLGRHAMEHNDRLDALAAAVAALRRDRDADDAAFSEIGDRLAKIEVFQGRADVALEGHAKRLVVLTDLESELNGWHRKLEGRVQDGEERLARCEGRDGEIIDRLRRVEMLADRRMGEWDNLNSRLDALESLAKVDKDTDVSLFGMYGKLADRLAALEARARDGGDPLRRNS